LSVKLCYKSLSFIKNIFIKENDEKGNYLIVNNNVSDIREKGLTHGKQIYVVI
jgi:hypothetical protein